ncbi:MAG: hypothetical protein GQ531_03340 [Sulfurovum sp.]|nr:hypothetical protein [Sulfurovum sp.]
MHILLINSNPVISRLLVLCTRDDAFVLEEVSALEDAKRDSYNVVFVDEASYGDAVKVFLEKMTETLKVFISFDAVQMPGFDLSIKKPFLPSEIRELIKRAQDLEEEIAAEKPFIFPLAQEEESKSEQEVSSEEIPEEIVLEESIDKVLEENVEKSLVEEATHLLEISEAEEQKDEQQEGQEEVQGNAEEESFIEKMLAELEEQLALEEDDEQEEVAEEIVEEIVEEILEDQPLTVLNADEVAKIKALLEMDDSVEEEEELSDEALEARKIEVIKEQLIADGLEIVEENEMIEELSIQLDGSLEKDDKSKNKESKKKKSKKIKFTEENMEHIEDAVEMAMASMTKKQMKKLLKGKEISISVKLEGKE